MYLNHSSIFYIGFFHTELLVPFSSGLRAKVASPLQGNTETDRTNNHAHTHTEQLSEHVSGLCENPCMHRENVQTPCRKTPGNESNPRPSCCKATVQPTAPPCSPLYLNHFIVFLDV
ncbi:hypothetical protein ILYODFUR_023697 [Ilyodon furcidens]|uniref:Uncharacterized protein n=1 Tax=Ilyodon furcidens TaxID=33524 RepID=A0ABV0SS56_9TELE